MHWILSLIPFKPPQSDREYGLQIFFFLARVLRSVARKQSSSLLIFSLPFWNVGVKPVTNVTLFFGLAKSDKIEFVIQKATELGVKNIVLFQGKRSVVKFTHEDFLRKETRYISIAKEAAEQCHREYIPTISFVKSISDIKNHLCDVNLFAYELNAGKTNSFDELLDKSAKSISVIIGPEGGFDESEAAELNKLGFKNISLGKRILRCETAAVYALSVIAFNLEK